MKLKNVPSCERYGVSKGGKVFRLSDLLEHKAALHGRILWPRVVLLSENDRRRVFELHNLVASLWRPELTAQPGFICHTNGNVWDNRAENLMVLPTSREAKKQSQVYHYKSGADLPHTKLLLRDIERILRLVREGVPQVELAEEYDVSPARICQLVHEHVAAEAVGGNA